MHDWRLRARFVGGAVFCLAGAFVLAKTGRDALFVQDRGLVDLPMAYVGIAALSVPLAMGVLALLRRYGPRAVRLLLPVVTGLALVLFSVVVRPGGGLLMTSFFMFVPLLWGVIFSSSWLLASDLLDGASEDDTVTGYSLIGAAAILGGVAGAGLARLVAPYVDPRAFLWFAAGGLIVAAAVMAVAQRRYPPPPADDDHDEGAAMGAMRPAISALLTNSYTRALVIAGMAAALVGVFVEFRFYLAAAAAEGAGRDKAAFFANFYLVLNLAALAVQVWVLPRLVHRVGVAGALLVLPIALVGGTAGLAISASLVVASTVRVAEGGLKSSIHRTSWEQAFRALAGHEQARAKVLVDGLAVRVAEGLAGATLLVWIRLVVGESDIVTASLTWLTALLVVFAAAWLASTYLLAREIRTRPSMPGSASGVVHAPLPAS